MSRTRKDNPAQASRSWVAVAAHQRPGAGAHGGGKRARARRDRQAIRRDLRNLDR